MFGKREGNLEKNELRFSFLSETWISYKAAWVYLEIIQARNIRNVYFKSQDKQNTMNINSLLPCFLDSYIPYLEGKITK